MSNVISILPFTYVTLHFVLLQLLVTYDGDNLLRCIQVVHHLDFGSSSPRRSPTTTRGGEPHAEFVEEGHDSSESEVHGRGAPAPPSPTGPPPTLTDRQPARLLKLLQKRDEQGSSLRA